MITYILLLLLVSQTLALNSTYQNPILPGFHPDPSCIYVPELDHTYFCASSSFLAFPGIPIHASKDLRKFKLISNILSRPEQLPGLNTAKRATSGIWAPTLRYQNGTFHVITTMVYDDYPYNETGRFDNLIFTTQNPFVSNWSDPVHFDFAGYDTSPFWDEDGQVYITGTYAWEVIPGIQEFPINLETGEVGNVTNVWNGTGGSSPEGPHIYKKDGYFYLLIAEGGTGAGHKATIARSQTISGPYESDPANPVLSNAGTLNYFQNTGHADLFQDFEGNWWAVALSVRQGPDGSYPMGRETILTPVTWEIGHWPIFSNATGNMEGWYLQSLPPVTQGEGILVNSSFNTKFEMGFVLGPEFLHWRFPVQGNYGVSVAGHENSLQLVSSVANLTGHDGRSAEAGGQTFVARRQVHTYFDFSVDFDIEGLQVEEQEVGVSVFLDQLHHYDLGIVLLASTNSSYGTTLIPHFRIRSITTVPTFISFDSNITPIPPSLFHQKITLGISAQNLTHYELWAQGKGMERMVVGFGNGLGLTWGFTGALLGVYATSNGGVEGFDGYVSRWEYEGVEQVISD